MRRMTAWQRRQRRDNQSSGAASKHSGMAAAQQNRGVAAAINASSVMACSESSQITYLS